MADFPVVTLTPKPFAFITKTVAMPEIPKAMGEGFGTLSALFAKAKATMGGMPMAHYTAYDSRTVTFELGFPALPHEIEALKAAGLTIGETPSGPNMTAIHMGPYDGVGGTYAEMNAAMDAKGLKAATDMWETYYSPPDTPPEQIKTEVTWPVS